MNKNIVILYMTLLVLSIAVSCKSDLSVNPDPVTNDEVHLYTDQVDALLSTIPETDFEFIEQEDIAILRQGPAHQGSMVGTRSDTRQWYPVLAIIYCKVDNDMTTGTGVWYGRKSATIQVEQKPDMTSGFVDGRAILSDHTEGQLFMSFVAGESVEMSNKRFRQNLAVTLESGNGIFAEPDGNLLIAAYMREGRTYPVVFMVQGWLYFGDAEGEAPSPPALVFPKAGEVLDNGCQNQSDTLRWDFEWSPVASASRYQLYVRGANAISPVINDMIENTYFSHACSACYIADFNASGWTWKVRAQVNGVWSKWSDVRTFDVEPLNSDCTVEAPELISPAVGDILDNGCLDQSDPINWSFEWAPVSNAKKYHLYVMGGNASIPRVDKVIEGTYYDDLCSACYITNYNATGWSWKVRAQVNGIWSEWSEVRTFNVEAVNTDCMEMVEMTSASDR